jgi:hypothetical protein
LVLRAGAMGLATLYVCSFVNFAQIVAAQQLGRDRPDIRYVCDLGPMAAGALHGVLSRNPDTSSWVAKHLDLWDEDYCAAVDVPSIRDWRDWGFRRWQVVRRVQAAQAPEDAHEDPDRR